MAHLKNKAPGASQRHQDKIEDAPFNTSRTVVVSAKISRKYSGGVLRGSIPRPRKNGSARGGPLVAKEPWGAKEEWFTGAKCLVGVCWVALTRS
jgi:hypothetical protein